MLTRSTTDRPTDRPIVLLPPYPSLFLSHAFPLPYLCLVVLISCSWLPQVAEGVPTAEVAIALAAEHNLLLPVLTAVAQVVSGELKAREAVDTIMQFPQVDDVEEGFDFFKDGLRRTRSEQGTPLKVTGGYN